MIINNTTIHSRKNILLKMPEDIFSAAAKKANAANNLVFFLYTQTIPEKAIEVPKKIYKSFDHKEWFARSLIGKTPLIIKENPPNMPNIFASQV